MSITATVGDGYFVSHIRRGERMQKRCKTLQEAELCLKSMMEDIIVDTNYTRWYFQPDRTLILRKPRHTYKQFKSPYLDLVYT
jgi:hypothetical protein